MAAINRYGFGQVEPNHLSFQASKQAYGQLPVSEKMEVVENGMFLKYSMVHGKCLPEDASELEPTITEPILGEWLLVYNEIKLYDDWKESYKDFALQKKNFTPGAENFTAPATYQSAKYIPANAGAQYGLEMDQVGPYNYPAEAISHGGMGKFLDDSLGLPGFNGTMYTRVVKTNVGDIFTTNCLYKQGSYRQNLLTDTEVEGGTFDIAMGDLLTPDLQTGYLVAATGTEDMVWQVVKVYTMPDMQPAVKIQRVK